MKQTNKNFMAPKQNDPLVQREQFAVSLRKQKTHSVLKAKRMRIQNQFQDQMEAHDEQKSTYWGYPEWQKNKYTEQKDIINRLVHGQNDFHKFNLVQKFQYLLYLFSDQNQKLTTLDQLAIITFFRIEITDTAKTNVVKELLQNTYLLSLLSQILASDKTIQLTRYMQLEAAWILTTISFTGDSEDMKLILNDSFGFSINSILNSVDFQMIDQVLTTLSNCCSESLELRNLILSKFQMIDIMTHLVDQSIQGSLKRGLFGNIIWCVRNLCRNKFIDSNDKIASKLTKEEERKLLSIIMKLVSQEADGTIILDSLWALDHLLENDDDEMIDQICNNSNMVQLITNFLKSPLDEENAPAIKCVGRIFSSSNPGNTDLFLFNKTLDSIDNLLTVNQDTQIMKELLWILSNLTAGTDKQIEFFQNHNNLFSKVFGLCSSQNFAIQRESCLTLTNLALTTQDPQLLSKLIEYDSNAFLEIIIYQLKNHRPKDLLILDVLQSLYVVLSLDQTLNLQFQDKMINKFEQLNGIDCLEQLQTHPNQLIYKEVDNIISTFFEAEEIDQL